MLQLYFPMIDINKVRRYSLKSRASKVKTADFAAPPLRGAGFARFVNSLPNILKAKDLGDTVNAIVSAKKRKKSVIFMSGAHVIKCGLNPVIIGLIKKKVITCLCLNGAGIIHDFEIAFQGKTSEDVAKELAGGRFGMGKETADFLNHAVKGNYAAGLGYAVAKKIADSRLKYKNLSIIYQAYKSGIPVCVFVALGTDIIHQHPSFDPAFTAKASFNDFRKLVAEVKGLNNGGVLLNFGSAVIMPEVFLKALNLARNLGNKVKDFTAANFDMIYHYRPSVNITSRPVQTGGRGFYFVGHHEIMLPLLAQSVIEKIR